MVRQPKVRAQAPLGFFADGRGARVPVAGHGADRLRNAEAGSERDARRCSGPAEMNAQPHLGFSGGTDYFNTGKMGATGGPASRCR